MQNAGLDEAQAGIKIARRNISNLGYTNNTILMAESEEELKSLLMKVKESEKAGLQLNIRKTKIMAPWPITSWQIDGGILNITNHQRNRNQTETRYQEIVTADRDSSHEIKRHLLLGRKAMTNLDSVLKSRHITLLTKVHILKAMVFPAIMYRCESWTIKEAEHWRTDAFKLWYWKRLLRVLWTGMSSNLSVLKKINPRYSWKDWCWSWSSNTLATLCKEPTHWKRPWCWERLRGGGEGGDRGWDGWMASQTQWT